MAIALGNSCKGGGLTICGGGNGAHALLGLYLLGNDSRQIRLYLPIEAERKEFLAALSSRSQFAVRLGKRAHLVDTKRIHVTGDPEEAASSRLVFLVVPAFAHGPLLSQLAPYLHHRHVVATLPARSGFEYQAFQMLRREGELRCCIVGLQTLPWACRTDEFAHSVSVVGIKHHVGAACIPGERMPELAQTFSDVLDLPVIPYRSMLELGLANTGQLLHPGIMYACFANRRDEVYASAEDVPLFYGSVDEAAASVLSNMSDEVLAVKEAVEQRRPDLKLDNVMHMSKWLLEAYRKDMQDTRTLSSMLQSNRGYHGLRVPVTQSKGGYQVDVHTRYLTEDLPFGLVVTRGIAALLSVATPVIDEVIVNTSAWIEKEYLVSGAVAGRDIRGTRAPQRYGIQCVNDLIL